MVRYTRTTRLVPISVLKTIAVCVLLKSSCYDLLTGTLIESGKIERNKLMTVIAKHSEHQHYKLTGLIDKLVRFPPRVNISVMGILNITSMYLEVKAYKYSIHIVFI